MKLQDEVLLIAATIGVEIRSEWTGLGDLWPLLNRMREDKAVFLLTLDGSRAEAPYTAAVLGGPLGTASHSVNADSCDTAIGDLIVWYAEHAWGHRRND